MGKGRPRAAPSVQGTECGVQGRSRPSPRALGSATVVPFLFQSVSSAMMTPFPPLWRAAGPCHQGAAGPNRQGFGATLGRPSGASPNILGDQIYLMVKGLVPGLTARALRRASGPPTRPCIYSRTGARGYIICTIDSVWFKDLPSAWMCLKAKKKKGFFSPRLIINDKIPSLYHCLSFGTMFRRE